MSNRLPRTLAFAFCASVTTTPGRSDLPLTVEDLLVEQDELRLELGTTYANEVG